MGGHRDGYKIWKKDNDKGWTSSYDLFEKFGLDNIIITLIELYPCASKDELHKKEREHIEKTACVNKNIPARTGKEYYEANKEIVKENYIMNRDDILVKRKRYYFNNKDKLKEKYKEYRDTNKEVISEKKKEYNEINRESISERRKKYREQNSDIIKIKKKAYYEANKDEINIRRRERRNAS